MSQAIRPANHIPRVNILHTEAKLVEFNGINVVSCKLMNVKEILNNIRSNKNIIKIKRCRKNCMANRHDRENGSIMNKGGRRRAIKGSN